MKHIHFIGICGVAMGSLALAFKRAGHEKSPAGDLVPSWKVTGSDVGFYPPMSTYLKDAGVNYYPGWHPEKIGTPDLVVVGNVASSQNPEWLYVQEKKLNYKSYPEAIAEYFVKENSIVCAGTYGKTSSSALLSWILKENDFDPTYMFGGLTVNKMESSHISQNNWSVLEGDEYKSARWDNSPKFSHYSPTHLLLTAVNWDHADVYPTEDSYFKAFENLVKKIPKNGLIVACTDNENVNKIISTTNCQVIKYGKNTNNDYSYSNLQQNKNGIEFDIFHGEKNYHVKSPMLGEYQAENIVGCFAMALEIGIEAEKIIKSIAEFTGMRRRLEKRREDGITIFDDIAHSPMKAKSVLQTLKKIYSGKIIAIFEPNSGNRQHESAPGYDNAFNSADTVIIPRLTKIKIDPNDQSQPLEGEDLKNIIFRTQKNVLYIDDDKKLIEYIIENTVSGDVVVFLGSHGFRGMIEELTLELSKQ